MPPEDEKKTGEGEEEPKGTPAFEDRLAKINAIGDSADAAKIKEAEDQGGELKIEDGGEDVKEEDLEKEPEKKEPEKTEEIEDEMEELVVDGKTVKISRSKILDAGKRTLQKETTADERLKDATEKLNTANKMLEEIKGLKKPDDDEGKLSSEKEDATDKTDVTALEEKADALWAEYHEEASYGDEEEAKELLKKARKADREVTLTQTRRSDSAATIPKNEVEFKEAVRTEAELYAETKKLRDRFSLPPDQGGFADIESIPILLQRTKELVDEAVNKGEGDFLTWELYEKAGNQVRKEAVEWVDKINSSKGTGKGEDELKARREKKREIENVPKAGASAGKSSEEEEKSEDETRSDAVEEMRLEREKKKRGM